MKLNFFLYILVTYITWAAAKNDLLSYVKHLKNRTFNPLEGKVITIKIDMSSKKYEKLIETAQVSSYDLYYKYNMDFDLIPTFEEKVNMTTIIDGKEELYEKVNFKIGGRYARVQDRIGFNIKLKKDKLFYNRKDIRLRPDGLDYYHIRSKVSADLMNRWNIPTVQEAYTKVYINDHYYGLYFLIDAIKPDWVRKVYGTTSSSGDGDNDDGEDDVKTLYHCQKYYSNLDPVNIQRCINEKEEYLDYTEPLYSMVDNLMNVTTIEELGNIFNVENFTRMIIAEYLFSAFDNYLIMGHNFHVYQKPDGQWEIIDHDFDSNFGVNLSLVLAGYIPLNYTSVTEYEEYVKLKFDGWYSDEKKKPIIDILYYNNKERFVRILKEMLVTGFNPDELFPRIDALSKLVEPYVKDEVVPNEDGIYPGRINLVGNPSNHTMEMFYNNTNFVRFGDNPGLKDFIQKKFNHVCANYKLNKQHILVEAFVYRSKIIIKDKVSEIKEKAYNAFGNIVSNLGSLLKKLGIN